ETVVTRRLSSMGYTVTSLQASTRVPAEAPQAAARETSPRVGLMARALFLRQLATATRAGIPLYLGLAEITRTVADRRMAGVAHAMAQRVERGERLSEAMAEHPQ